jgi:hypothetical protein
VSGRARLRGAPAGIAGALALSLTLSGCLFGGASEPDIAATVEGTQITSAQVNELYDIFANTDTGADDLTGADGV